MGGTPPGSTDPELEARVMGFWNNDGLSYTEISRILKCSRGKVAGIVSRFSGEKRAGMSKLTAERVKGTKVLIFSKPKTKIIPKLVPQAAKRVTTPLVEPDPIGPVGDFPPVGTCRFTRDEIRQKSWKMCGHPVRLSRKGSLEPWCPAHGRIAHEKGQAAETKEEMAVRMALHRKQQKDDLLGKESKDRAQSTG